MKNSNLFNLSGKRIYPQELKLGESGYRLAKHGWFMKTTLVEIKMVNGVEEQRLDMALIFMPWFRGRCGI